MSKINLFSALSENSASNVPAEPLSDWKSEPISIKQIVAIARMFRSKDLLALPEGPVRVLVSNVAVFDDESGQWPEVAKLTKGQGSDLIAELKKLPAVGFSKVTTGTAEPNVTTGTTVTAPAPVAKKATKSTEIAAPALGVHETADGLRFEVYKTAKGQIRTRMV